MSRHCCVSCRPKRRWQLTQPPAGFEPPSILPTVLYLPLRHTSLTSQLPVSVVFKPIHMNSYVNQIHMNSYIDRRDTYEFIYRLNLQKGSTICPTSEIVCFSRIYFYIFAREKLRFFSLYLVIFLRRIFFFMHTNWYPTVNSFVQDYR